MLALSTRFTLNFKNTDDSLIFPHPKSNQYQTISDLRYSSNAEHVTENEFENSILLFPPSSDSFLSFTQVRKAVNYDIDTVKILSSFDPKSDDKYISATDSSLVALSKKILGKTDLSLNEIVRALYEYQIVNMEYGNPIEGLYTYSEAMNNNKTDCGGFATLLASLLKVNNISSRLVVGHLMSRKKKTLFKQLFHRELSIDDISMHAWLEIPSDKGWFPLDPSIEWKRMRGLSKRLGGFGHIPNDRLVLSYGHNNLLNIRGKKYYFPIMQHPEKLLQTV